MSFLVAIAYCREDCSAGTLLCSLLYITEKNNLFSCHTVLTKPKASLVKREGFGLRKQTSKTNKNNINNNNKKAKENRPMCLAGGGGVRWNRKDLRMCSFIIEIF